MNDALETFESEWPGHDVIKILSKHWQIETLCVCVCARACVHVCACVCIILNFS
jgi:hypothetical protein